MERILDTLQNPKVAYETKDAFGNKASTYIEKDKKGKTLIVVTRNGKTATAYEPDPRYLNKQKEGKRLY